MLDPSAPPDSAGQLQPGGDHEAAPASHEAAPPAHATTAVVHNTALPPFWTRNPRTWFTQVEARFHLHHITSQATKYNSVVTSLPGSIADELADILDAPHPVAPYDHLKAAIIQRKSESERSRLQQLLNAEELGDRRPSQLLHSMRHSYWAIVVKISTTHFFGSSSFNASHRTWSWYLRLPRTCHLTSSRNWLTASRTTPGPPASLQSPVRPPPQVTTPGSVDLRAALMN